MFMRIFNGNYRSNARRYRSCQRAVRDPQYWDPIAKDIMESQQNPKKDVKTSEKS